MDDRFTFILPAMQATFGVTAVMAGRWQVPSAWWWAGGFLGCASAFAMPTLPAIIPLAWRAAVATVMFVAGFLCFGEAMRIHFGGRRTWMTLRISIALITVIGSTAGVLLDNLRLHLAMSDLGCALLMAVPLVATRHRPRRTGDQALILVGWAVATDCMMRVLAIHWLAWGGLADFAASPYAILYQTTGSLIGTGFAMAALASIMISVLMRYRDWAICDPLTGLLNRRGLDEALAARDQIERCCSALILADIDHFKTVNDRFGHHRGDEIIALMASTIEDLLPRGGLAARYGGEEFLIYLPHVTASDAAAFAEMVRHEFAARTGSPSGVITASFGVAAALTGEATLDPAIRRADQGLYRAKHTGRNRSVIQATMDEGPSPALAAPPESLPPRAALA